MLVWSLGGWLFPSNPGEMIKEACSSWTKELWAGFLAVPNFAPMLPYPELLLCGRLLKTVLKIKEEMNWLAMKSVAFSLFTQNSQCFKTLLSFLFIAYPG